ncbi:MAG: histidine ammonia-lyase [Rhodothermales bacterium]
MVDQLYQVSIPALHEGLQQRIDALQNDVQNDASSIQRSRDVVEQALQSNKAYYGINTGFGYLKNVRIDNSQVSELQHNLLLSHAVGVGDLIPKPICRLMLQLKIHALGQGYSGVSPQTFSMLLAFAQRDLIPAIPRQGSVGASGDLAPLSHMSLPLIGYGFFWDAEGKEAIPADQVLAEQQLSPIQLAAKDGLALINGTQLMTAYGAYVLSRALSYLKTADIVAAMSLEALQGSILPFDERVHLLRPHKGQIAVADNVRRLLRDSEILESHRNCGKVQDPYSLRCVPQVHGASKDAINHAVSVVETEINSVTDNPLVFENGDIISGGNFHGQPLALVLDFAAIALAEIGSISERRTYLLLEGHDGLPALLMKETGINSGFMIPQYTSAALVSENKVLCHPASVDSIPTSLGQEDHVSMGSIGALKLFQVMKNVEHILAIELFTAAQALDFRKPLKPGRGIEAAHNHIRSIVPHGEKDYYFKDDLNKCADIVTSGDLVTAVESAVGPLH